MQKGLINPSRLPLLDMALPAINAELIAGSAMLEVEILELAVKFFNEQSCELFGEFFVNRLNVKECI